MLALDVHERMSVFPFRIVSLSIHQFCGGWKMLPANDDADGFDVGVQIKICEDDLGLCVNSYAWLQSCVQDYNNCGDYANQA